MTEYLRVEEINRFSQGNRRLFNMLFIKVERVQVVQQMENLSEANHLYCRMSLKQSAQCFSSLNLAYLRFGFSTKDQGFVEGANSSSWI